MTRFTRKLALLLLGGMLCPVLSQMQAQSTQSSILGTVSDVAGAVVPRGESLSPIRALMMCVHRPRMPRATTGFPEPTGVYSVAVKQRASRPTLRRT